MAFRNVSSAGFLVPILGLVLLFVATPAWGGGFILYEHGAGPMGQSSAVVARPDDPSAVFYNPAGLAWQEGVRFMVGNTMLFTTFKHELDGVETEAEPGVFATPNFFASWQLSQSFSLGLGSFAMFGLGTVWPEEWSGRESALMSEVQAYTINPCFVWRPLDWLAVGVGFDLVFASLEIKKSIQAPTDYWTAHLGGNAIGFGGNLGLLVRPLDGLSLGLTYRSATQLEAEGQASFQTHPAFQDELPDQGMSTSVTLPHVIVGGVAYSPLPGLEIEVDLELVLWSAFDELRFEFEDGKVELFPQDWEDGFVFRVGAQYEFEALPLAIRLGYIRDWAVVPDRTLSPLLPDADRNDFSIGLGYDFGPFVVDASYLAVLLEERTVTEDGNIYHPGTYNGMINLAALHVWFQF